MRWSGTANRVSFRIIEESKISKIVHNATKLRFPISSQPSDPPT
jgi:hypothetical protein